MRCFRESGWKAFLCFSGGEHTGSAYVLPMLLVACFNPADWRITRTDENKVLSIKRWGLRGTCCNILRIGGSGVSLSFVTLFCGVDYLRPDGRGPVTKKQYEKEQNDLAFFLP